MNIFVSGAASYKWINESTSSFTLLDETGVVVNNSYAEAAVVVSNVTASGTITLKPKNKNGTIVGTETITINVLSKPSAPALSVVQPSGANSCLATLSCTNAGSNSILWWPTTGILGDHTVLSDDVIDAKPLHPTAYNNVLINSNGCFNEMQATEIAFSNKKLNIGAITQPCYGQDVTLSVTDNNCSTSCAYKWTSSSGQSGTGTSFVISDIDKTAIVFVERTDNAVCVEGASKTVKVNPEFDSFQWEFSSCEEECIRLKFQMKNSGTFCYDWANAVISTAASGATAVLQGWMVSGETCNGNNPSSSSPQAAFKATNIGNNTTAVFTVTVNVREDACTTACYNQAVFTITVSKPPAVSITPQPVQYCTGGFGAAAVNLPAGSKVVFMDGAGLDQTTSNEVMASPPAGGSKTYEFTVINEAGCCTHGYEIEFEEVEDCCNSGDGELYTYMNPTSQTLIYNLALKGLNADWNTGIIDFTALGKELSINGNLTLYSSLSFVRAADISLANDAAIHLNGKTLTLNRSSLYSCDGTNMWTGIDNNGNTTSKLVITGTSTDYSKIKEAITAVKFTNGGEVQIEFCEFDNNWIDVSINNFCNGLSSGSYIRASKFLNTAGTGLKAPHNGQQKNTAIFFYKTDGGTIGSTSTDPNIFDRGDYGFQITKSKITLLNNDFSNFTNSGSGYAIYASNELSGSGDCEGTAAFIKLGDGTSDGANNFSSSDFGIFSKSHKLTIDNNSFTDIPRAVYVESSTGKPLVIQNNVLSETQFGISLLQTQASSISVFNNDIELSGLSGTTEYYGIKQADNGSALSSTIEDNIVNIEDNANCKAIYLLSANGAQLINNTVYWNFSGACGDPCPAVYGIRLEDATECTLDCNHISGTSTIASYIEGKRGISLSYSPSCKLTCNTTDKLKSGLEFLADCNNAVIKGSTLNAHKYGILVGYETTIGVVEGVIGNQSVSGGFAPGNRYQGNNNSGNFLGSGYGLYRYLSSGTNPPNIIFDVLSNTTTDFYTTSSASNKSNGAIQQSLQEASSFACDENCQSTLREGDDGILSDSLLADFETIVADSAEVGSTYEVTVWSMQKNVYEAVNNQPQLQDSSEVLSDFMEKMRIGTIGKLVLVEHLMQQLSDTTLTDEIIELKHDSASQLLATIETEKIFEQNAKDVYTIYLNTLHSDIDTFSEEQKSDLYSIAIQCPYYGGPVVYNSRSLYSLVNDSACYNDEELCALQEQTVKYERPSSGLKGKFTMDVYPNPTDDMIAVKYHVSELSIARFQLTDTYGRILIKEEVSKSSGTELLSLKALPSGIYHLALITDDHVVCTSKIFKTNLHETEIPCFFDSAMFKNVCAKS